MFTPRPSWSFGLAAALCGLALTLAPLAPNAHAGTQPSPDFTPFAGEWVQHSQSLTVCSSGDANMRWRTYNICSATNPKPCDAIIGTPDGKTTIEPGGFAQLHFATIGPATGLPAISYGTFYPALPSQAAHGAIAEIVGGHPSLVPGTPVTLVLGQYDTVLLITPDATGTPQGLIMCGLDFGNQAPDSYRMTVPCGA
jgi:hypothetical protein